jgi:hypothetical protein
MITSFNSLTYFSNNYDLLETESENPSKTALWVRKKFAESEAKARASFATKQRKKHYQFSGITPEDHETSFSYPLTDEEVERIKKLTVEAYKAYIGDDYDENWANTFEDICQDCELQELEGINPELDELIFDIYDRVDGPFTLHSIDLKRAHYFYYMTYQEFGKEPQKVRAHLTDEEYIYLLTWKLTYENFNFNRLLLFRPELAQKISVQLDGCNNDYLFESNNPYLIVFDEVNDDAETIMKKEESK